MFPTSILAGTYGATVGSTPDPGPDTITYHSFVYSGIVAIFMAEFNNNLYAFPNNNTRIKVSTDSGSTWNNSPLTTNVAVGLSPPVVESNKILFINGGASNNYVAQWDGTNSISSPVSGTSSLAQIGLFQKIGNYYYINDYGGPLERSTSLGSGWSNISNTGRHRFITESGGTFIWGGRTGFNGITKDNFNNVTSAFSSNIWMDAMATDGNGNWVGADQNQMLYSTDDGDNWNNIELRSSGDTLQINIEYSTNILNIGNKFVYLDKGNKKLLSISTSLSANPTVTVEKDFTDSSATRFPIAINKIGDALYVTDAFYGYHKFDLT